MITKEDLMECERFLAEEDSVPPTPNSKLQTPKPALVSDQPGRGVAGASHGAMPAKPKTTQQNPSSLQSGGTALPPETSQKGEASARVPTPNSKLQTPNSASIEVPDAMLELAAFSLAIDRVTHLRCELERAIARLYARFPADDDLLFDQINALHAEVRRLNDFSYGQWIKVAAKQLKLRV